MSHSPTPLSGSSEPTWAAAHLYPPQGQWTEGKYLSLTESLNRLVELVDGNLEVLESPTRSHQKIVHYLLNLLLAYLKKGNLGDAISAPYRVRIRGETFREPDICVYLTQHQQRFGERYGEFPDLVIEVVSDDPQSRTRDYEDKRRDYATAGIPEYWIVDPAESCLTVLTLTDGQFAVRGQHMRGHIAESHLLPGFSVEVDSILAAAVA